METFNEIEYQEFLELHKEFKTEMVSNFNEEHYNRYLELYKKYYNYGDK